MEKAVLADQFVHSFADVGVRRNKGGNTDEAGVVHCAGDFRGAADAYYTPLCPVIVTPEHFVVEEPVYSFSAAQQQRRKRRRVIGTVTHRAHIGSRTFAGGWLTALFGSVASIPLVTRILFPRTTWQLRKIFGNFVVPPVTCRWQGSA